LLYQRLSDADACLLVDRRAVAGEQGVQLGDPRAELCRGCLLQHRLNGPCSARLVRRGFGIIDHDTHDGAAAEHQREHPPDAPTAR
jgi:hypothetical protein